MFSLNKHERQAEVKKNSVLLAGWESERPESVSSRSLPHPAKSAPKKLKISC